MGITKTLGGDRLGAGKKMTVTLDNFGRSSHNIGKIIATDQAAGTIVPYFCDIALNGTTHYIGLTTKVRTLPTNGPIFGSFKHQIDCFSIPIRLYIAALHNNALGIGLRMQNIKLPIMKLRMNQPDFTSDKEPNSQQISQDSLLAYLGVRGGGKSSVARTTNYIRKFPAIFLLAYWDIYKNYYANKQEEIGFVIGGQTPNIVQQIIIGSTIVVPYTETGSTVYSTTKMAEVNDTLTIQTSFLNKNEAIKWFNNVGIKMYDSGANELDWVKTVLPNLSNVYARKYGNGILLQAEFKSITETNGIGALSNEEFMNTTRNGITLNSFELSYIDAMREAILAAPKTTPFDVSNAGVVPYTYSINTATVGETNSLGNISWFSQAGLGLRTYLSDRFNNWLSTEWIEGTEGINEITAVDVSDGKLTMDALILAKKVFNMLNRIAISDGSYDSWQESVYGVKAVRIAESPIYWGGMSSEIVFDEVVSNSSAVNENGEAEPLGTLAGRGSDRNSRGGKTIKIKTNEPSMIMILGSIVPRIKYSQGNKWWTRLETMNDFHKPSLDQIGFQNLLTDEFAAADTNIDATNNPSYNAVGFQPSWIEYQTNVDESYGSFAAGGELEWMILNRRYHYDKNGDVTDATTYIDPTIYNAAFADAELSAKNFWVQVAIDCTVRRVMSAKQIPNL